MSRGYVNRFGDPIELADVTDQHDDGPIEALTIDSWNPDPWTYDAVVAGLILAFQDDAQTVEAPW